MYPAAADDGEVISEWPPRVEAPATVKGPRRKTKRAPAADAPAPRSRRGAVIAFLVALFVGVVLSAVSLGLPVPFIGSITSSIGASGAALPSSGGWTTWIVIAGFVIAVLAVGLAIATSQKKGWRWILDTRVVGLVAAMVLVSVGLTQLFPPGAQFDIRELPGLAGNALQGTLAQPESGYPRIKITRVSIDLLLVKGDGKSNPPVKYEAFTFPEADHLLALGSDGKGNNYVYAHARTGMFWNLHNVHIGDVAEVDYGGGKVYPLPRLRDPSVGQLEGPDMAAADHRRPPDAADVQRLEGRRSALHRCRPAHRRPDRTDPGAVAEWL